VNRQPDLVPELRGNGGEQTPWGPLGEGSVLSISASERLCMTVMPSLYAYRNAFSYIIHDGFWKGVLDAVNVMDVMDA
jgi:hypothetical protein